MSVTQAAEIVYPDQDGKPMADNTEQARWIFVLYGNLEAQFRRRDDVFVAADNLWYPVEGRPDLRQAPDVYVVFGRPKGRRGSYQQWKEGDVPLTAVFEILSPGNEPGEEPRKHLFYEEYGVEEYYVYDPDANHLTIYTRGPHGAAFRKRNAATFTSPRLGIRFDFSGEEMTVIGPDGKRFLTFSELTDLQEQQAQRADQQAQRADQEAQRADALSTVLDRIRVLSRKRRAGTATPEELAELDEMT